MTSPDEIVFRRAEIADIPVIQDLSSRIWREHYPGIITHAQIDYMLERMYSGDVIQDEMGNRGYQFVIVSSEGKPVGYISYRREDASHAVMLSKLYLLPSLHGRGIGTRMLQYVRDDASRMGAQKVYLFVNKSNVKAIRVYELSGFIKAQEVVTDIGGGFVMDDYRMELDLREK